MSVGVERGRRVSCGGMIREECGRFSLVCYMIEINSPVTTILETIQFLITMTSLLKCGKLIYERSTRTQSKGAN